AVHGFWAHQGGCDDRGEPGFYRLGHAHLGQRHFKLGTYPFEEVEARAGDFGAAFHVNGAQQLAEFKVIAGFEIKFWQLADSLEYFEVFFTTRWDALDNEVREDVVEVFDQLVLGVSFSL